MAKGFKHGGGGGSGLDFRVLDGLEQPASPRENDIWVACEGMTGWLFSATEPESPSEGMVWINVGASSPAAFNAVKKNAVMVYPLAAAQYIDGAWVEKKAKSYQGGAWADWTLYLFNNGDQCVSLTGGWAEFRKPSNTTVTVDNILAVKSDSNGQTVSLSTVGAVDLTDAKTLWITSPGSDSGRYAGIVHLCTSKDISTSVASVTLGDSAGYKSGTYSIDVSSLNGSYHIFMIATAGQYGAGYADASEIWME